MARGVLTQAAAAWVLACVFVRFIEDNGLIDTPSGWFGTSPLALAKDQRTLYFQQHPTDSDRDYLFTSSRRSKPCRSCTLLFDERHNPLWTFGVSGDGATLLVQFWQRIDPATGALAHDFADPALNTRFLGDLYQDLSEAARKNYALLQTPEFVEEFILDRTLTPAIRSSASASAADRPSLRFGHFLLVRFIVCCTNGRSGAGGESRDIAQRALTPSPASTSIRSLSRSLGSGCSSPR